MKKPLCVHKVWTQQWWQITKEKCMRRCGENPKWSNKIRSRVSPSLAQSYKVLEKSSWSCEAERSVFPKMRLFRSRHKVQRIQGGTMFQTFEWGFPNPQKRGQEHPLAAPRKYQRSETQNSMTQTPSHNELEDDLWFPHPGNTCNTSPQADILAA